jgi:hypothetical protein
MIQFGEWLPDQADLLNNGVTVATNVMPALTGYHSMNSFVPYSNAATGTIKGLFAAKDTASNTKLFAGDATKLYLHASSDNDLDDISKGGGYTLTDTERWRFVQFGDAVIAAGGVGETPQSFTLGSSSVFADLAGSPPKADFIAVVRDFVWTANIDTGSGRLPFRCYWSGFNDPTSWTSGTNQSDFQDLPDSGAITGLVGGEYATVLTEKAIFRATYTGPPLIWQFDKVVADRGCAFKESVCNVGQTVFYLASDGFYAFNGQSATPIGSEKVNEFFLNDFDSNYDYRMSASVDPINEVAMWSYTSTQSPSGQPDKIIIYNYTLNKWSLAEVEADLLSPIFSSGYTVDALDNLSATVDGISIQLDSRFFKGGQYFFGGAFGNKIYSFTGAPLAATIETSEAPLSLGKNSVITRVYPYYEEGDVTMQIGTRNAQSATPVFTSAAAPNDAGFVPFRSQGRYHRARLSLSGGWSKAIGVDIEARGIGTR